MVKFGARPPDEYAWQVGKTAASIRFVQDAEGFIQNSPDDEDVRRLRDAVTEVKEGNLVFSSWMTPAEFLQRD